MSEYAGAGITPADKHKNWTTLPDNENTLFADLDEPLPVEVEELDRYTELGQAMAHEAVAQAANEQLLDKLQLESRIIEMAGELRSRGYQADRITYLLGKQFRKEILQVRKLGEPAERYFALLSSLAYHPSMGLAHESTDDDPRDPWERAAGDDTKVSE
ncbi:hypothetical protein FJZ39_04465 [Candidatus Saccharibacteria bacterium]|nr:hypothetical protein [Candidatus Saccharibacteria bacterium]